MSDTLPGPPADPSVASSITRNQQTLGGLADMLARYERALQFKGPFVRSMSGQQVSGWSEIQGQAAHSAGLASFRQQIESLDRYQELRTFTLRQWGEQLTATICGRLVGELLRRFPEMNAPQIECLSIREAVQLLLIEAPNAARVRGREDDPTVSNLYQLIDTGDALALVPHRWRELTPLDPNGYDAGWREQGKIWHAVFGGNGVAGLVQRASAELRGEVETTAIIREMGNWLERWGRAFRPFPPVGDRDSIIAEQAALPVEWWLHRRGLLDTLTRLGVMVPDDLTARPALNQTWNRRELVTHCDLMGWLSCSRPVVQYPAAREVAPATPPASKPKRSAQQGDGRAKLISLLTAHHKYEKGSCMNPEPIGNNDLARKAEVEKSTASAFFKKEFKGYSKYRACCRDVGRLADALTALNGEFSPHDLYGRRPPGEDDRHEKE